MNRNLSGGKHYKKKKRNSSKYNPIDQLIDNQMFGLVCENLGQHVTVLCSDGIKRKGLLSGKTQGGPRLSSGTYVAVSLREFEKEKKNCDVLGIANPPSDVINLFRKNDKKDNSGIKFVEEEDNSLLDLETQKIGILNIKEDNSNKSVRKNNNDVWKNSDDDDDDNIPVNINDDFLDLI